MQVTPGVYDSFVVKSWQVTEADICDQRISLSPPLEIRGLITADGTLWMSDVPQERLMMFNNAKMSRGHILVGGLGLGLYPQYAMPHAESITVIEANSAIRNVVEPMVRIAADAHNIPLSIHISDIHSALSQPPTTQYDTVFLDTWDTLDASYLPVINRLRNLAISHLADNGRILLWGYAWMLRLFSDACRHLLEVEPSQRVRWLEVMTRQRPNVMHMLNPVIEHFEGQPIEDFNTALAWCHDYAIRTTEKG
jgi:spermidine synthase